MSSNAKNIFVNFATFISLAVSWWLISLTVSDSAAQMNGKYFDAASPILAGSYYNDWLPVFAVGGLSLGWILSVWAASFLKHERQAIPFLLFAAAVPGLLIFVISIRLAASDAMVRELFDTTARLFVSGAFIGAVFGVLRRMEKDLRAEGYLPSQP